MTPPLYNRDLLALAVATGDFPPLPTPDRQAEQRAPLCGSRIRVDMMVDDAGRIAGVGMRVEACVIGQASATLMARHAAGQGRAAIAQARDAVAAWLAGEAGLPDWPGFEILAPARDYPARHGAILLPFAAAVAALGEAQGEVAA